MILTRIICESNFTRLFYTCTLKVSTKKKYSGWYNTKTLLKIRPIVVYSRQFMATERPVRQEPGAVRMGFIPNEWFEFFFSKTGVSGFGTFCFTFSTFLISKEYYIMEHEYYGGLSMAVLCILGVKYVGPSIAKYLDKEVDKYEKAWVGFQEKKKNAIENLINIENRLQRSSEGQLMLVEAKRENVALQLEAEYRERLMMAYNETKKRLEYCVACEQIERALAKRRMAGWITAQVQESITENLQERAIKSCLEDLEKLAKQLKEVTDKPSKIK